MKPKLDEIDKIILKSLMVDARTNFAEISKKCKVSVTTIQNHYNKLRKEGVIKGTLFSTNSSGIYEYSVAVELIVIPKNVKEIMSKIKELSNYVNVFRVVGKFDLHAIFHIKNIEDIKKIRNDLSKIKGIQNIKIVASNQVFGFFPLNLF